MAGDAGSRSGGNMPRPGAIVSRSRRLEMLAEVNMMNPTTFKGTEGPEEAETFLQDWNRISEFLEFSEAEKLIIIEYHLRGDAEMWWRSSRAAVGMHYHGTTWEQFHQAFLDRYFPATLRMAKMREFELLEQGEMSVDEHERKFTKLSKYAPHLVATPELKVQRYSMSLNPIIWARLVPLMLKTYEDMYRRAQLVEMSMKEMDEYETPKSDSSAETCRRSGGSFHRVGWYFGTNRKPSTGGISKPSGYSRRARPFHSPACSRCGRAHGGMVCPAAGITCHECGRQGHIRTHCPQLANSRMGGANPSMSRPHHMPSGSGFKCLVNKPSGTGRVNVFSREQAGPANNAMTDKGL